MASNIQTAISGWSTTAGSNQPDSTDLASTLREDLQAIQAAVRYLRTSGTIASASTTDMATKSEEILSVSGTTTITALGTVSAGMIKVLVFEGALTFTYNVTSLILPTGASITTAAGDVAIMLSLGSGNWRCLSYTKASGYAPANHIVKISEQSASSSSTITFTGLDTTYKKYILSLNDIVLSADAIINLRLGNGSVDTGTNYSWTAITAAGGTIATADGSSPTEIQLSGSVESTTNSVSFEVELWIGATVGRTFVRSTINYITAGGTTSSTRVYQGFYNGTVDRVQLLPSTGNFATGTFALYGFK